MCFWTFLVGGKERNRAFVVAFLSNFCNFRIEILKMVVYNNLRQDTEDGKNMY